MSMPPMLSVGQLVTIACQLEVCAPKPGNVHRGADFPDATLQDFIVSAVAIGAVFDRAAQLSLGDLVLESVRATQTVAASNTNLGMILLLAPIAKANLAEDLSNEIHRDIQQSNSADAEKIYEAIRLANPGGMSRADEHDVSDQPPAHILTAMQLAEDRDLVARQYSRGFSDVFEFVVPTLLQPELASLPLSLRIVHTHVATMAQYPDSLILRKLGEDVANQSAVMAQRVLDQGSPDSEDYQNQLQNLDFWLRCDGNRRNPGTTADMIAAALLVALRQGKLTPPFG